MMELLIVLIWIEGMLVFCYVDLWLFVVNDGNEVWVLLGGLI